MRLTTVFPDAAHVASGFVDLFIKESESQWKGLWVEKLSGVIRVDAQDLVGGKAHSITDGSCGISNADVAVPIATE